MDDILRRISHAVTTASNDDMSKAKSEGRARHNARIETLQDASAEIRLLRSAIYKWQTPENQGRAASMYLTAEEKVVVRQAVAENL